jgi:hypothetical protein
MFLFHLKRQHLALEAGQGLLRVYVGAASVAVVFIVIAKAIRPVAEWPAAWELLMLGATLAVVGLPKRRELFLLLDETS